MYILGISEIDNDAGITLLKDREVVCAISEERLSRKKRHQGFPHLSIAWALEFAGITLDDIDHIAIAKADPELDPELFSRPGRFYKKYNYLGKEDKTPFLNKLGSLVANRFRNGPGFQKLARKMAAEIRDWLDANGVAEKAIRVPHHYSHAACAYWASGFERTLAVTMDGQGEGATAQVYLVDKGKFELLKEIPVPHSLGAFYAGITKACGYQPAKHEGKITGLAAYGKPTEQLLENVRKLAFYKGDGEFAAPGIYGNYPRVVGWLQMYGRDEVCAAFQMVLEEVVEQFVGYWVRKTDVKDVVLAGGVCANVKLNQRILEIKDVDRVFVFPHMADGGLGYGAAQHVYREKTGDMTLEPITDVYWGPEYSNDEIEAALKDADLAYDKPEDYEGEVAALLEQNKVIALFQGRMEFGPRALGARTIMYPTTDARVNDWLNDRLERSEFMPFAPVTLAEEVSKCYVGYEGTELTNQFMTITYDCTDEMKAKCPAVVHVDGTARPQVIHRDKHPRYYDIVKRYHDLTGVASVVNTSFNMHEEPIVCSPKDAIRAFLLGHLDYLAIGDFLVKQPG
ncbi:MAG: carbamoyltransferase [Verrucomicrobiales bacterium]|jgi:carbamoyltransferase